MATSNTADQTRQCQPERNLFHSVRPTFACTSDLGGRKIARFLSQSKWPMALTMVGTLAIIRAGLWGSHITSKYGYKDWTFNYLKTAAQMGNKTVYECLAIIVISLLFLIWCDREEIADCLRWMSVVNGWFRLAKRLNVPARIISRYEIKPPELRKKRVARERRKRA